MDNLIEIARLSRKQCEEIRQRVYEQQEEDEVMRAVDRFSLEVMEVSVTPTDYPFYYQLARYINEHNISGVEVRPTDIATRIDNVTNEVVILLADPSKMLSREVVREERVNE